MGKGDRKTAKGKRNISSYGNVRTQKSKPAVATNKAVTSAVAKTAVAKPAVKKVAAPKKKTPAA